MSALPRPDLPPGPHRDLVDALHELHHHAGWPSLRTLARETGVSHTTVSHAFSSPKTPTWGTLELLVEAMHGDTTGFHDLWLTATTPATTSGNGAGPTGPRIAGRRDELTAVRRHLESGTGLLLVTGEAGIGKTKLVTTAADCSGTFVATGHGLPLSSAVPLLPVATAFRSVNDADEGRWLADAMGGCPDWVPGLLARLVPELAPTRAPGLDEGSMSHLLGIAVGSALAALAHRRPLAVLLEDLHWADTATLDLLEQLMMRSTVPLLATWRLEDPTLDVAHSDWFTRVRRTSTVQTLALAPLDAEETRDQLTLLAGRAPRADVVQAIHTRSQGLPLFTEQLAAEEASSDGLPGLLADLLDARLGELTGATWATARALGVADRALTRDLIAASSGLDSVEVGSALRELADRQLLSVTSRSTATLRHPLLADAIRRRLVPGEAEVQHADLARALAASPEPVPAEVARHWQLAGNPDHELSWRIRAARVAHERFALHHEAEQWVRALELWPPDATAAGHPAVPRYEALVAAMDLVGGIPRDRVAMVLDASLALVPDLAPLEAAELLQRVGDHLTTVGEVERGLEMVRRSLDAYDAAPPCEGHVRALFVLDFALRRVGRLEESAAAVERGLEIADQLEDRSWYRRMLIQHAWAMAREGRREKALTGAREAAAVRVAGPDPRGEALLAGTTTDILLLTGADVEDVVRSGQRGLDAVAGWGLDTYAVQVIRLNMSMAMRRAGHVRRAHDFILNTLEECGERHRGLFLLELAPLEMLQGRLDRAIAIVAELDELRQWSGLEDRIELEPSLAEVELWADRPDSAFRRLMNVAADAAQTESAGHLAPVLGLAARAAADAGDTAARQRLARVRGRCSPDPYAEERGPVDQVAWGRTWTAEMARSGDDETLEDWVDAATEWDRLRRPHDAAYCRWRAAQVALGEGRATLARRLLTRAAADAQEHVPLHRAIAATVCGGR